MGNSQSHPDPRERTKLSKPKTFARSSHSTVSSLDDGHGSCSRWSKDGTYQSPSKPNPAGIGSSYEAGSSSSTIDQGNIDHVSPVRSQRLSLSTGSTASEDDQTYGELASHIARRLSTKGSVGTHLLRAASSRTGLADRSRSALESENRAVTLETAVAILAELRKTATPDDLAALHTALLPEGFPEQATSRTHASVESTLATAAVIRRTSLAMPGIASRRTGPNRSSQTPSQVFHGPSASQSAWKPEMICASPLTKLIRLDGESESAPRAETPGDMEYSHLGPLKIGSLIVTNGPASPTLSVISRAATPKPSKADLHSDGDYFTLDTRSPRNTERGAVVSATPYSSPQVGLPFPVPPLPRSPGGQGSRARSGSPLRRQLRLDTESILSRDSGYDLSSESTPIEENFDHIKAFMAHEAHSESPHIAARHTPLSASFLASQYMAEIPSSPFESSTHRQSMPNLRRTFSYEVGDEIDEGVGSVGYSRSAALGILVGRDEEVPYPPLHGPFEGSWKRPVQPKSDSGYSSLADHASDFAVNFGTPLSQTKSVEEDEVRKYSRYSTDSAGFVQLRTTHVRSLAIAEDVAAQMQLGPSEDILNSPDLSVKSPSHDPASPTMSVMSSVKSSTVASPTEKASLAQKKLQKRRPMSVQVTSTMRDQRPLEGSHIPTIPPALLSRLSSRLAANPSMEHLAHTYENTSGSASKGSSDSLGRKVSTSIPATYFHEVESSSKSKAQGKYFGRVQHSRSRSMWASPPRNTVSSMDGVAAPMRIADFGDIAKSLGASPYDITFSTLPRKSSTSVPRHPYQMGASEACAAPTKGMDSAAASKLALWKSRERASADAANPRTFYEPSQVPERSRAQASLPRPKSTHFYGNPTSAHDSANAASSGMKSTPLPPAEFFHPQRPGNKVQERIQSFERWGEGRPMV
ncbi:hypothetical protein EJ06DRAFT_526083 [Trichodelitschia bisporula]|uniref:Uncharacterized protein n=1 Tax=Trichodelitschia bisporula TaxID=703511 RepID=A0A6G1IBI8_9PEZI|nr:hypothetical protein EJ06DRAFT_526083 [Trichodelitschia bisporula]